MGQVVHDHIVMLTATCGLRPVVRIIPDFYNEDPGLQQVQTVLHAFLKKGQVVDTHSLLDAQITMKHQIRQQVPECGVSQGLRQLYQRFL